MRNKGAVRLILTLFLIGTLIGSAYGAYLTYKSYVEIYGTIHPLGDIELDINPLLPIEGLDDREDYVGEIHVWTYSNDTELILQLAQVSNITTNFNIFTVKVCLPLDMIFVIDTSLSMTPHMSAIKNDLTTIVDLLSFAYKPPLRFGVVGFKDYDGETVQRSLTHDYEAVKAFINSLAAADGGDPPESHYLGLRAAKDDFATNSKITHERVVVFISNAPAGEDDSPSFAEAQAEADEMAELGIKIDAVLCGPDTSPQNEQLLYYAYITRGWYIGPEGQNRIYPGVTGHPTWIVKLTPVTPFDSFHLKLSSSPPCQKEGYYTFYVYIYFYARAIPWHERFYFELMASLEKGQQVPFVPAHQTRALSLENIATWYWVDDTTVSSVAVGDVDGDGKAEIVTGGSYFDGVRYVAQLDVWDGATLSFDDGAAWYWVDNTTISSVAIGNVDGDNSLEIVTGGSYFDGTRTAAQLCVWDGATLSLDGVTAWYWVDNTTVSSVAVGDVDGDGKAEIVTGGSYFDGARYVAQLCVWDGATLSLDGVTAWYWVDDTTISSVAVGDVDDDSSVEIVTGGSYFDGARYVAQLDVWDGATLSFDDGVVWDRTGDTSISSVAIGDVDKDGSTEIVTGGNYHDGARDCAELDIWGGSDLAFETDSVWYWVGDTHINSVAIGDIEGSIKIATGGDYHDGVRIVAQLTVWIVTSG